MKQMYMVCKNSKTFQIRLQTCLLWLQVLGTSRNENIKTMHYTINVFRFSFYHDFNLHADF